MVLETSENLQVQAGGVKRYDVWPCVMRKGPYHPSESDLLKYALQESERPADTATESDIEDHLADCLYCRIRLNRIKIRDPRLEPPAFAVSPPPVSDETLELLAANPPSKVEAGQVWLAQGDHGRLMVWIGRLRSDTDAAMVHPVTPNTSAVDDSALVVELPNVGSVGVVSSPDGSVDLSRLVAHLGDLDIASDLPRVDYSPLTGARTGLKTGRPITSLKDERHEFDQFLIDQLADLDPIIEPDDEDDYMLSDGWEPGLVFAIPGPCHPGHLSEPDLLGYALDVFGGAAGGDVAAALSGESGRGRLAEFGGPAGGDVAAALSGESGRGRLAEFGGPAGADVQAHLADCLFCRIRLNRMRRCDPRLEPPRHAPTRPQIPEEILRPLAADPPADVQPGQVWLAGRPGREQVMVWVRGVFPHAIMAHAVTFDIGSVEDLSLIADLPAVGCPVAVVSSVSNTVPRETLVAHLGDLDVKSALREAREAALSRNPTDLHTGRPITDPNDERNEFLHMLADDLAALDPTNDLAGFGEAGVSAEPGEIDEVVYGL